MIQTIRQARSWNPEPGRITAFTLERLWRTEAGPQAMIILSPVGHRYAFVHLPQRPGRSVRARVADFSSIDFIRGDFAAFGQENVELSPYFGPFPYELENGDGVPPGDWIAWMYDATFWDGHDRAEPGYPCLCGDERRGHLWTSDEVAGKCEVVARVVTQVDQDSDDRRRAPRTPIYVDVGDPAIVYPPAIHYLRP